MATDNSCGTCKFWHPGVDEPKPETVGDCRWRPPTVVSSGLSGFKTQFPKTKSLDWCGQWAAGTRHRPSQEKMPPMKKGGGR